MILTKTFTEVFTERRGRVDDAWSPVSRPEHLDTQVNKWVRLGKVEVLSAQLVENISLPETPHGETGLTAEVRTRTLTLLVSYKPKADFDPEEDDVEAAVPLVVSAKAPTVDVMQIDHATKTRRPAQAMAGIFGVPEGTKLHPADEGPAPVTLLSPDLDLTQYADLFGNVRKNG